MTAPHLIKRLNLPQEQIDRIQALAGPFADFERILSEGGRKHHAGDSPFQQGILSQSQNCINLIAGILGEDANSVQQALLQLFGLTEAQFEAGASSTSDIVALSAFVEAKQH